MMNNIYYKQEKLYDATSNNPKIIVYGAGSIGSHVVVGLAKIGVRDITVYDYDVLEESNLPAQFYNATSTGLKTEALRKITQEMTGTEIVGVNEKISPESIITPTFGSIHILAFDNIEARHIIFNKLKGFPVFLIDGRIGGFQYEKYCITCSDEHDVQAYEKTLEGNFSEQECGMKCLWAVNGLIAAKIIGEVLKIVQKQKPIYAEVGYLLDTITLVQKNAKEE